LLLRGAAVVTTCGVNNQVTKFFKITLHMKAILGNPKKFLLECHKYA